MNTTFETNVSHSDATSHQNRARLNLVKQSKAIRLVHRKNSKAGNDLTNKGASKRWLCNVSEGVKLSKGIENALNIPQSPKFTQYDLMVKLLKAETCDVIYFDCHLSSSQIGILKMLQVFSNTELVHARLAMQFDREIS